MHNGYSDSLRAPMWFSVLTGQKKRQLNHENLQPLHVWWYAILPASKMSEDKRQAAIITQFGNHCFLFICLKEVPNSFL